MAVVICPESPALPAGKSQALSVITGFLETESANGFTGMVSAFGRLSATLIVSDVDPRLSGCWASTGAVMKNKERHKTSRYFKRKNYPAKILIEPANSYRDQK